MATSGSTNFSDTARQVIANALFLVGVIAEGDDAPSESAATAQEHLNLMLKTWGTMPRLWLLTEGSQALTASQANYALSAARRVLSVRRQASSVDTPMSPLNRKDYYDLPNKAQTGTPLCWYFDPQRSTRTLYVWPTPDASAASNITLKYTYQRVVEDVDALGDDVDFPQEWLEALTYGLAARLCIPYGLFANDPTRAAKIEERAEVLQNALSTDDEDGASVFLQPAPQG